MSDTINSYFTRNLLHNLAATIIFYSDCSCSLAANFRVGGVSVGVHIRKVIRMRCKIRVRVYLIWLWTSPLKWTMLFIFSILFNSKKV